MDGPNEQIIMDIGHVLRYTAGTSAPVFVLLGVHQGNIYSAHCTLMLSLTFLHQDLSLCALFADVTSERVTKLQ